MDRGLDGPPKAFVLPPSVGYRFSPMPACLISLGSNLGNRQENLDAVVARLAEHPQIKIIARSAWHETTPIGGPAGQENFLNGAVKLETSLAPLELLTFLQQIE